MQLVCFPTNLSDRETFTISCEMSFKKNIISLGYFLQGPTQNLQMIADRNFSKKLTNNDKKNELWLSTCFEFFFQIPGSKDYFELNLSALGAWNFYHLDSYRTNLQSLDLAVPLDFKFKQTGNSLSILCDLTLPELAMEEKIKFGMNCVLHHHEHKTYWAFRHLKDKPDFHDSSVWILS